MRKFSLMVSYVNAGIANLAATCITLLGFEPPEDYAANLVKVG
ncbi:MAG: hypothetical protein ACXW0Q_11060 [Methylovulum sp.]